MDSPDLLMYLEQQNQRLRYHHTSVWEEIRHFSWIVLGGWALAFTLPLQLSKDNVEYVMAIALVPFFTGIVARVARNAIAAESRQFLETLASVLKIEKALGLHEPHGELNNFRDPYLVAKERTQLYEPQMDAEGFVSKRLKEVKTPQETACVIVKGGGVRQSFFALFMFYEYISYLFALGLGLAALVLWAPWRYCD